MDSAELIKLVKLFFILFAKDFRASKTQTPASLLLWDTNKILTSSINIIGQLWYLILYLEPRFSQEHESTTRYCDSHPALYS